MEDLKNYDNKLVYVIIFNAALVILINKPTTLIENNGIISIILTVPVLYLPIYIINNLFSREWKLKILYPNNKLHRFSYGIFTKLNNKTIKYNQKLIDVDLILNTYGIPKTKTKEDELWYKIYLKHRYENKIYQQNRRFLFCRDIMATVIIITPTFSILSQYFGFSSLILTIILIGIFEFIIFWKLAREQNKILSLYVLQEETEYLRKKINYINYLGNYHINT